MENFPSIQIVRLYNLGDTTIKIIIIYFKNAIY